MSAIIKELLKKLKEKGVILDKIEILGIDKETAGQEEEKEDIIEVGVSDYKEMDRFGEKNVIYGANVGFEDGTKIEFVYNVYKWVPYLLRNLDDPPISGMRVKSEFLKLKPPEDKHIVKDAIDGKIECPKCKSKGYKTKFSVDKIPYDPDNYRVVCKRTREGKLEYVIVRCNKCGVRIRIAGFPGYS